MMKKGKFRKSKEIQTADWIDTYLTDNPQEAVSTFHKDSVSLLEKADRIYGEARDYVLKMKKAEKLEKHMESFFATSQTLLDFISVIQKEAVCTEGQYAYLALLRQVILKSTCQIDTIKAMVSLLDKQKNVDPSLYADSLSTMKAKLDAARLELEMKYQSLLPCQGNAVPVFASAA